MSKANEIKELEDRLKKYEEELMYLHRDMNQLFSFIGELQKPEQHMHYTVIVHTKPVEGCEDCDNG